jgi:hypothetical protein
MLGRRVFLASLAVCGCRGGPARPPTAELAVLFMGNSHTSMHDVPGLVAAAIRGVRPGVVVTAVTAPGWGFLDERAQDPASLARLRDGRWDHVVLQAQKYSATGRRTYSTAGAEALIRLARAGGAVPVLFPEWPRRGVDEARRIHALHREIAARAPACVAPVGLAWDLARGAHPDVVLHAGDGDHAAAAGALLAALVLAATITGASPDTLPNLVQSGVPVDVQFRLRGVAAEAIAAAPPCRDAR